MYKLCRVDIERSEELINEIKAFATRLKKILPVREVYLYGSFAKGEIHEGSDIDLLIIGDFGERFFDRIGKILDLTDLPIEPLYILWRSLRSSKNLKTHLLWRSLRPLLKFSKNFISSKSS